MLFHFICEFDFRCMLYDSECNEDVKKCNAIDIYQMQNNFLNKDS